MYEFNKFRTKWWWLESWRRMSFATLCNTCSLEYWRCHTSLLYW